MLLSRHDMARGPCYSVFFRILHASSFGKPDDDRM
jgi:hypothetical protein